MPLTIAFDADDTLWHNETVFIEAQETFRAIVRPYLGDDTLAQMDERLHTIELRNLQHFGYGIKGFILSMMETAIELTSGRVRGDEIQRLIDLGRWMLSHPVDPLPGVADVLAKLAETHPLMLVTKGDLFDQESKLARSGLGGHFARVEVVSAKTEETYRRILDRYGVPPATFLMVGNSLRSDVLPVVAIGAHAVHVPCENTWVHEHVEGVSPASHGFREVAHLREIIPLVAEIEGRA